MSSRSKRKQPPPRGRHAPPPRKKSSPLSWPVLAVGVVMVVLGVAAIVMVGASGDDKSTDNELAQKIEDSIAKLPAGQQNGLVLGSKDAPLELEIFEDFQCPFCITFTGDVEPMIVDEFVATGKVRLVYRNFPILGAESELAARGSVCAAEQGKGWEYGLTLFSLEAKANQVKNEQLNVGRLDRDSLLDVAKDLGLRTELFNACLDRATTQDEVVKQFERGKSLGVQGTPSFAINGTLIPRPPSDADGWRALLNERLSAMQAPAK